MAGGFTDGAVAAQLQRGLDMSVPLDRREATTPRVDGTVTCADKNMLNSRTRASLVEDGQDTTPLRLPSNAAKISRNAPIPVVRGEEPDAPVDYITEVGGQGKTAETAVDVVYADRPAPADMSMARPEIEQAYQHGIGVQRIERQTTQLGALTPIRETANDLARETVVTNSPSMLAVQKETAIGMPLTPQKKTITIASDKMGRHRVRVVLASVSDTAIFLGYLNSDEETVIEPPEASQDDPLTITIDGKAYKCASYGLVGETVFVGIPLLLIALVRVTQ